MKQCQSCGLPLHQDPSWQWWWSEKDWTISQKRCSLCYKDGQFVWGECTLAQMQTIVDNAMKAQWFGRFMRTMVQLQMPHLERWKWSSPQEVWFVRKLYGRGRTPSTRQWWIATLFYIFIIVWLVFVYGGTENQPPTDEMRTKLVVGMVVSTLLFLMLCYIKGEPPKRQWGKRK